MSCQTFRAVLVYLKARTIKSLYTVKMHFISTAFSSIIWACVGLFSGVQTLHYQSNRSCWSSRPTINEFARTIWSTYGRVKVMAKRARTIEIRIIILSINSNFLLICRQNTHRIFFSLHSLKSGGLWVYNKKKEAKLKKWKVLCWGSLDFQNDNRI